MGPQARPRQVRPQSGGARAGFTSARRFPILPDGLYMTNLWYHEDVL